jgi:nitrite reductase/ring-hydroxylating ferredoxin subunit
MGRAAFARGCSGSIEMVSSRRIGRSMDKHVVARIDEVKPGEHIKVTVRGRDIALFNLAGEFYAIGDRCPHEAGSLSTGCQVSLAESDKPGHYRLSRRGEFIKCPWHGWEFDIKTGQSYCDPFKMRVRSYEAAIQTGEDLTKGPYIAETFRVSLDADYVVIEL